MMFRKSNKKSNLLSSSTRGFDSERKNKANGASTDGIMTIIFLFFLLYLAQQSAPHLFHTRSSVHTPSLALNSSLVSSATPNAGGSEGGGEGEGNAAERPEQLNEAQETKSSGQGQGQTQTAAEVSEDPRRLAIRSAFLHAYHGYERAAFGHDEIRPVQNITNDSWNGWGVTLVDALDTMILMQLEPEVARARAHIADLDLHIDYGVSFFETMIRYVGGLLGAYTLTHDALYLERATELAGYLSATFDSPSGFPYSVVNLMTGEAHNHGWNQGKSLLSEVGSCQLEFGSIAHATPAADERKARVDRDYAAARRVYSLLGELSHSASKTIPTGLVPVNIDPNSGRLVGDHISFGSLADSYYEYLLKLYLLSSRQDQEALRMYVEAVDAMEKTMIVRRTVILTFIGPGDTKRAVERTHTFLGELQGGNLRFSMEHLACFVPGLLALGASLLRPEFFEVDGSSSSSERTPSELTLMESAERHLQLARELTETCVASYSMTATGLGPEAFFFPSTDVIPEIEVEDVGGALYKQALDKSEGLHLKYMVQVKEAKYILRPETLESIFILYRTTGDTFYQDWGWRIWQAIDLHCRTPAAFSGITDVEMGEGALAANWNDSMQSFFLAETLKYLYLLFSPVDLLPLQDFVFNTEAHPLAVWRGEDRKKRRRKGGNFERLAAQTKKD